MLLTVMRGSLNTRLSFTVGPVNCGNVDVNYSRHSNPIVIIRKNRLTPTDCGERAANLLRFPMKILIADDEDAARYGMSRALTADSRCILEACNGQLALDAIYNEAPDLVFLDLNMPVLDGMQVLRQLQGCPSVVKPEIIVVTANDTVSHAVDCIRCGASDFITKPYDIEHLRAIVRRSEHRVQLQLTVQRLQVQVESGHRFGAMTGASRPMQNLFKQIERAARTAMPVLIRGESGSGKELVARELHLRSHRADQPFVAVNTAAIAESLVESELFGHVKGAFTGADQAREGVFRQANGGTLFLDEIGDMPPAVQTRLLRVLQESVIQPVGTERSFTVDVRIISATHQVLEDAIQQKIFRQDLYYRLKGIELFVPPLRNRQEDILLLASEFLGDDTQLSSDSVAALIAHPWPGNVRELKQMVQSAVAMSDSHQITPSDLGLSRQDEMPDDNCPFERYLDLPLTEATQMMTKDF